MSLNGPPQATLARRAKSYSDFYDVATSYLSKQKVPDRSKIVLDHLSIKKISRTFNLQYEHFEHELLDASHEEFQYDTTSNSPVCF